MYGIRGKVHDWLSSILNIRSHFVHYTHYNSENKNINHGVPQGSIMGALLFIIYINDFSSCSDLLFSILFAEGTNYDMIIDFLNEELKQVDI